MGTHAWRHGHTSAAQAEKAKGQRPPGKPMGAAAPELFFVFLLLEMINISSVFTNKYRTDEYCVSKPFDTY